MKKVTISLFAAALLSGCSTTPSNPRPHPEKYTFQVISIEIPDFDSSTPLSEAINHPDATIHEYPIVLAGVGESQINDQTESVSFPEDYSIVDGKAIAKEKTVKLGYSVSIQFTELKNELIQYHLQTYYREVAGHDKHEIGDGITVSMPYFKSRRLDTDLSQAVNSWVVYGGLVDEKSDGTKLTHMIGVRIIPPKNK